MSHPPAAAWAQPSSGGWPQQLAPLDASWPKPPHSPSQSLAVLTPLQPHQLVQHHQQMMQPQQWTAQHVPQPQSWPEQPPAPPPPGKAGGKPQKGHAPGSNGGRQSSSTQKAGSRRSLGISDEVLAAIGGAAAAAKASAVLEEDSSDWWNIHGMHMRIPPLWADLQKEPPPPARPGYATYTQWARAHAPAGTYGNEGGGRSRNRSSRSESGTKRAREDGVGGDGDAANEDEEDAEDAAMDALREEDDRWKRCWAIVVRRDIPKQHRLLGEADLGAWLEACLSRVRWGGLAEPAHGRGVHGIAGPAPRLTGASS